MNRDMGKKMEMYERRRLQKREEMEVAIAQKNKKVAEQLAKEQKAFRVKIDAAEQADLQVKWKS